MSREQKDCDEFLRGGPKMNHTLTVRKYDPYGKNTPVQRYVDSGILKIKMVEGRNGVGMYPQVYVTSKGVAYFARVTKEAI